VTLGQQVATSILAIRATDGSNLTVPYTPGTAPGDWRPTPPALAPALLPQWPYVTPWAMTSGSQFRPHGVPDLTSAEYTAAFNEVKDLGSATSVTRTVDQTQIALFWANGAGTSTPPGHLNVAASLVAQAEGNTLAENARLFALLNVALADAAIASWDAKYAENFWRPITAIRDAATDGNPDTAADPTWTSLIATPPFPAYTSGHSSFSGAAAAVLAAYFGRDDISFTLPSENVSVAARSYTSFSQAAQESADSRLYGGIHWRFDNQDGLTSGASLGNFVAGNFLEPDPQQNHGWVRSLYVDLLGRHATAAEVCGWVDKLELGAARDRVVAGFLGSTEYADRLIGQVYQEFLGRAPEASALTYWERQLSRGVTEPALLAQVLASDEFFRRAGGTNASFVDALYTELLGRNGDATAYWNILLARGRSRRDVAAGFIRGQEFSALLLDDGISLHAFGGWYQTYLDRAADQPGEEFWTSRLRAGSSWAEVQGTLIAGLERGNL